jgi:lauroyl/myristoyl acyltransferase
MRNLVNAFPEKSNDEIKVIARNFYKHLCDNFIESFYVLNMSEKEIRKRYRDIMLIGIGCVVYLFMLISRYLPFIILLVINILMNCLTG